MCFISIVANPVLHAKMKHVELDVHFMCEKVMRGKLLINHVLAQEQIYDLFTKPLSKQAFARLRSKLGASTTEKDDIHKQLHVTHSCRICWTSDLY
ncbi:putative N-acetyl-gamma-glutamyl-phosphate reductase, chloroplastic [Gossypium australe]|uniref:Putative N-acetyl-gamma-glutamyl-phosphate reductase, chloroplastic n=1 Tax=Gossypium australe TaxID=47621 RepID=A0A5B6VKP8_9ROSI|nr:putative N-acetyl-gamma-glutamyl-phosphate reductase, chloroplastic [Gossypium australe]